MKRPLVGVTLVYAGGLLLAECFQPPLALLFAISLGLAAAALCLARARPWLIWPLLLFTGWTNLVWRTAPVSPHDLRLTQGETAQLVTVRGRLCETPAHRIYVRDEKETVRSIAQVRVSHLQRRGANWRAAFGEVLVITPAMLPEEFFAGQVVEVTGVLAPPPVPVAEGLFDYRAYLRRQGVYYQLNASATNDWRLLDARPTPPLGDRFLRWARATLARGLPEEDEPLRLIWAMTLGWKPALTNEVYEPFMRSGTMHIFAISGLHIALIAGILAGLLRVFRVPRIWCGWGVIPLIWFYTAATGWQPSAIRSTVMMSIIIGGWALQRPSDLVNSLAAAAFIILLWDPQQIFGASFQLSFLVVLSIALLVPPLEAARDRLLRTDPLLPKDLLPRWRRWLETPLRWVTTSLAVSLAAWLGSLPLTAYYFHLLSPVTLLANLCIVPLSSLALAANLGSLLCGAWLPWATEWFNYSGWWWMRCMVKLSDWATLLPGAYWYVRGPSGLDMAAYYLVLIGVLVGLVPGGQTARLDAGGRSRAGWCVCLAVAGGAAPRESDRDPCERRDGHVFPRPGKARRVADGLRRDQFRRVHHQTLPAGPGSQPPAGFDSDARRLAPHRRGGTDCGAVPRASNPDQPRALPLARLPAAHAAVRTHAAMAGEGQPRRSSRAMDSAPSLRHR